MNYPFKKAIIDISNYFFLRKTIRQNREGIEWNKHPNQANGTLTL